MGLGLGLARRHYLAVGVREQQLGHLLRVRVRVRVRVSGRVGLRLRLRAAGSPGVPSQPPQPAPDAPRLRQAAHAPR